MSAVRTLLLLALCASAPAGAADAQFARSRLIEPAGDNVVQRLEVPADVYAWTVRDDLGDLRVVNGAGEVVPHALARPPAQASYGDWQQLPLFPLPRDPGSADVEPLDGAQSGARVSIELGDDGTVVAVRGGRPLDRAQGAWLIDASSATRAVTELNLFWPEDQADFVARLRVEASADLDTWRELVRSATVADLTTGGQRVTARRIDVAETDARYLRLTRLDAGALNLIRVDARGRLPSQPERDWLTLQAAVDGDGYEFDSGAHYPVDRLSVEVDRPTFLVEAQLWSRPVADRTWQPRGRHRFYRVDLPTDSADAGRLTSEPVAAVSDRYWRLRWADDTSAAPTLRIGWLPHELWFLRQGAGPFRLLYGRADTDAQPWPVRDLAERLGAGTTLTGLPAAALGEPQTLGGRASLEAAPQPVDWRTVLLWSVLLVGVALVVWLAVRVLR
ncbi:MAG: DUF3999 family protein [Pseudomonadales bacterium]